MPGRLFMISPLSEDARAMLPSVAAKLPRIPRLTGPAWLSGYESAALAATFNAVIYGGALTIQP